MPKRLSGISQSESSSFFLGSASLTYFVVQTKPKILRLVSQSCAESRKQSFLLQIVTLFTAVNLFLLSADLRIVLNYRRDLQTCQSGDCFQVSFYVLFHVGEHISGVHGTLSTLMWRMSFGKRCRTQQRKRVSLRKHVFAQSCYCLQLL